MPALIAMHKHLMSKWAQRGVRNTLKQTRYFQREEIVIVHICGHYYRLKECSSFVEVKCIAASLPMMLVAVQVPMLCTALASKMAVDMLTKKFGTDFLTGLFGLNTKHI